MPLQRAQVSVDRTAQVGRSTCESRSSSLRRSSALTSARSCAREALHVTFEAVKMNFACYGNAEPHVHWHIVPMYEDDPHPRKDPWR